MAASSSVATTYSSASTTTVDIQRIPSSRILMNSSPQKLDGNPSSLLQAIEALLALDPTRGHSGIGPRCGRYLLGSSSTAFAAIEKVDSKRLMKIHSLWNSILRFLLTPRTDDAIRELLDDLANCSCLMDDPEIQRLHQIGAQLETQVAIRTCAKDPNPSIALIVHFFRIIDYAMDQSKVKSVAMRATKTWPSCPNDLIPFGPEIYMKSFLQWARFTKDTIVYQTAAHTYLFCGSLLSKSFLTSHVLQRAIDCLRDLFDQVYGALGDGSASRMRHLGKALKIQLECLFFFLDTLSNGKMPLSVRSAALDGYELKSVEVLSLLAYLVTDCRLSIPSRQKILEQCCKHAGLLYGVNRLTYYLVPDILVHPGIYFGVTVACKLEHMWVDRPNLQSLLARKDLRVSLDNPEDVKWLEELERATPKEDQLGLAGSLAHNFLDARKNHEQCSAFPCSNTIQSTGRTFQRCAKCCITLYCGRECQLASWSDEMYPHKEICKTLRKLISWAGGMDVIIQGTSSDSKGYNDGQSVAAKWIAAGITIQELYYLRRWFTFYLEPVRVPEFKRTVDVSPGYDDYAGKLEEMIRSGTASSVPASRLSRVLETEENIGS